MVAVVVEKSQQSFAKHYGEEDGYEGEEEERRGMNRSVWVLLPSPYLSIYRRRVEGVAPLGFPLGGRRPGQMGSTLGKP